VSNLSYSFERDVYPTLHAWLNILRNARYQGEKFPSEVFNKTNELSTELMNNVNDLKNAQPYGVQLSEDEKTLILSKQIYQH